MGISKEKKKKKNENDNKQTKTNKHYQIFWKMIVGLNAQVHSPTKKEREELNTRRFCVLKGLSSLSLWSYSFFMEQSTILLFPSFFFFSLKIQVRSVDFFPDA